MSWVKENSFLAGFLGVTVVGAGVLGFLLMQAKSEYDAKYAEYEQEARELNRLQGMRPYPNAENVKKLEAQRDEFLAQANKLVSAASSVEIEEEPVTATQFQDLLRKAVDDVTQRAAARNMKLPDRFSLGFDRYLTDLPRPEAAAPLARQLAAVKLVVDSVIDSQVAELRSFVRPDLPEERTAAAGEDAKKPQGGRGDSTPLVEKHPIQLVLFGKQTQIRNALNKIVTSDKQFFIPRLISVTNEQQEGPMRVPEGAAAAPPPPAFGENQPAPAPAKISEYIVGEENVEFTLNLEIADFAETESQTTAKK